MIILDAITQSLKLITSTAQSLDYHASFVDITSSSFTPSSAQGNVAAATTTTIVAAPAAATQRQLKFLSLRNLGSTANTVTLYKDVSGTIYKVTPDITLQSGEALHYTPEAGFTVKDATGRTKVSNSYLGRISSLLLPGMNHNASLTGVKNITTATSFAVYVGKAPRALASVQVRYRVTTAAATITWAELAIAKGAINPGGNPTLTVVGFLDVAAVINSVGQKTNTVNVSSGQSIDEGDDLWLISGNAATTVAILRALSIADDLQVGVQASLGSRPSTIVGTATAWTIEGATILAPWIVGII